MRVGDQTRIEWASATWNPVTGCTRISRGCDFCYIGRTPPFRMAGRTFDREGIGGTTGVLLHPDRLDQPLRWTRPREIFVNSLSDLVHDEVPDRFVAEVFAVMALAPRHRFMVLTKRHGRMRSLLNSSDFRWKVWHHMLTITHDRSMAMPAPHREELSWPLPNLWLGVSVEDQARADLRIPALLEMPAAVRFLSCEPLLGPVDLAATLSKISPGDEHPWRTSRLRRRDVLRVRDVLHWVIVGGESGPTARPMHPDWARGLREECAAAGVPFFFKQWGEWAPVPDSDGKPVVYLDAAGQEVPWDVLRRSTTDRTTITRLTRVGKRNAGRNLDGHTWDEQPPPTSPTARTPGSARDEDTHHQPKEAP